MTRPFPRGISLIALLAAPLLATAAPAKIANAEVLFQATGPAGLKIEGKTTDLSVGSAGKSVRIRVALAGLDTGIALRNKHLKEKYLELEKYPEAVLEV